MLPVQRAVASAWPSAWIDAVVMCAGGGEAELATLAGERIVLDAHTRVAAGEPVAFHPVAEVLSADGELIRARRR